MPSYDSTTATAPGGLYPPITIDAVCVPIPGNNLLAVFKLFTSVQVEPLYSSVSAVEVVGAGPGPPPAPTAAV